MFLGSIHFLDDGHSNILLNIFPSSPSYISILMPGSFLNVVSRITLIIRNIGTGGHLQGYRRHHPEKVIFNRWSYMTRFQEFMPCPMEMDEAISTEIRSFDRGSRQGYRYQADYSAKIIQKRASIPKWCREKENGMY